MPEKQASALNAVILYAPADLALLKEFKGHLSTLINEGILSCWDDQEIMGGKNKEQEIKQHLDTASLILLLLSPDFFASASCYAQMQHAVKRQDDIDIIPILLRPCNRTYSPVEELQVLPRSEIAITSWQNRDDAYQKVVEGIHEVIDNLKPQRFRAPSSPIDSLPYERNFLFTGREEILDKLYTALHNEKSAALTQAISGLGGIGKTQTALEKRYNELLKRRGKNVLDHPAPVATTWSLSFEKVQQANPMSVAILFLCAFLDPDIIFEEIFTLGASQLGPILRTIDEDLLAFNDAIAELLNYSLIRRNSNRTLTIHRLVQLMLRNGMNQGTQRLWAERAILVIDYLFPYSDYENWPLCLALLPQARNAEPLYEQVLKLRKKVLREEHSDPVTSVNNLAEFYRSQGRYLDAELLYRQALTMSLKVLGKEHPTTLTFARNYLYFLGMKGVYEEVD